MTDSEKIFFLAKTLHDVINEICINDDRTIPMLKGIQLSLQEWINEK